MRNSRVHHVFLSICGHRQRLISQFISARAGRRHNQSLRSREVFGAVNDWSQVVCDVSGVVRHRQRLGFPLTHAGGHVVDVT